ncbi:MAG: hypothetical protein JWR84_713 [Caulobacter sp.]|nr:hypothetical protein [Caulobacter sp.]
MQTTPALIAAALALGVPAAALGLAWPAWPKLAGAKPTTLWIAAGLVIAFAALAPFGRWSLLPAGAALIFLALTDLRRFSLPWPGLAALALALALDVALHPETAKERLLVGFISGVLLHSLRRWSGTPPKLGEGDAVLAGLAAALTGWRLAALMLSLAAFAPLLLQLVLRRKGPIPFGFWLSLAALPAIYLATS